MYEGNQYRCFTCWQLVKDFFCCKRCGAPLCKECQKLSLCQKCINTVKNEGNRRT